jgi:hypothetical protein
MKEFPVPKPRTIECFETAHVIKLIVAWPIAAWLLNMVPSKPITLSSFESEKRLPSRCCIYLRGYCYLLGESPNMVNVEMIIIDSDVGEVGLSLRSQNFKV